MTAKIRVITEIHLFSSVNSKVCSMQSTYSLFSSSSISLFCVFCLFMLLQLLLPVLTKKLNGMK